MTAQLDNPFVRPGNERYAAPSAPRILCVDDEPNLVTLYNRVLQKAGYEVTSAEDGETAWDLVQAQHFDLVITDFNMPRMNGLEFARRVRCEELKLPLIMATAHVTPLVGADLSAIRFSAILLKPFSIADLQAAVQRALPTHTRGLASGKSMLPENQVFHLAAPPLKRWGLHE